jgi:hypothetical protein
MAVKYTQGPQNTTTGDKIYRHLPFQESRKFTQIWISGLKICHLATLVKALAAATSSQSSFLEGRGAGHRDRTNVGLHQGDQIGRILAHCANVYFEQFFKKSCKRSLCTFLFHFFP